MRESDKNKCAITFERLRTFKERADLLSILKEISVTANSDGSNVSMAVYRGGTKVARCFK